MNCTKPQPLAIEFVDGEGTKLRPRTLLRQRVFRCRNAYVVEISASRPIKHFVVDEYSLTLRRRDRQLPWHAREIVAEVSLAKDCGDAEPDFAVESAAAQFSFAAGGSTSGGSIAKRTPYAI